MNRANCLTMARLCATPFVIALMCRDSYMARYSALILFLVAMLTDVFDGIIARRDGKTLLGNFLDPVADKILILSVFITLSCMGVLPLWMSLAMLAREIAVNGVRDVAVARGVVIGANWMGKSKTFLQVFVLTWALFLLARMEPHTDVSAMHDYKALLGIAFLTVLIAVVFAGVFIYWHRAIFAEKS